MQQATENPSGEALQSAEPVAEEESAHSAAMVGSVLAAARLAQGLEIADIARSLKLSAKQVQALEAGDFASMRGNTFVRGFIRNYAKLLQVDPAPLLDLFQQGAPAEDHPVSAASQQIALPVASGRRRLVYIAVVVAAVIVAPILIYDSLQGGREPAPTAVKSVAPAPAARSEVAEPRDIQPAVPPVVETQPAAELPEVPPAAVPVPVPAVAPPEAVKPATPLTPVVVPQLRLVFEQASWVEIRDGRGEIVLSELSQGGSERLVDGRPPFALVVGNATHVRIDYNGKPVDLAPHTHGDVARLTLK